MKIIITEEQLKLLNESDLNMYLQGVEYILGKNVNYSTIRRIGKYLVDKNLIEELLSKSMKRFISGLTRSDINCDNCKYDVIFDTADTILYYYEDSWDTHFATQEESDDLETLSERLYQIRGFLDNVYGQKIEEYCRTIKL